MNGLFSVVVQRQIEESRCMSLNFFTHEAPLERLLDM